VAVLHDVPAEPVTGRQPTTLPTLGHALLSLLAREPLTGYGLAKLMKEPIGFFWEAQHSQIYPQLAELQRIGHVTASTSSGPGPRSKKTYAITDAGMAALRAWVGVPTRRRGGRDDLLLKVYASWVAEPSATLRLMHEAEADHVARLELYLTRGRSARSRGADVAGPRSPMFTDYATLRRGIGYERGRLAWCRWLIRKLESEASAPARRV
jgi:DNA-binding PadR family transcriptional regulator